MKKFGKSLLWTMVLSVVFLACSDEEPPPPHPIVGEWNIEGVDIRTIQFVSGPVAEIDLEISFNSYYTGIYTVGGYFNTGNSDYTSATYEFNNDGTFVRTFFQLGPDDITEGEWTVDDAEENITLDLTGTSDEEYEILGGIQDTEMTWSEIVNTRLVYPEVWENYIDTLTNYSFSSQEAFNKISAEVNWEAWIYFER